MPDFFDFLYDDQAPSPADKVHASLKDAAESASNSADSLFNSSAGRWVSGAATVGLVAGVAVGVFVGVVGLARSFGNAFSRRD